MRRLGRIGRDRGTPEIRRNKGMGRHMGFGRSDTDVVISTPLRTAVGTFGGSLKDVPATDLGATVGKAVLERSGIDPERVDQVIVGNILSAGQGMNPGRQVGVKSGVPVAAPGITLNRMCGSGLQAIVNAGQEIALGDAVVSGRMRWKELVGAAAGTARTAPMNWRPNPATSTATRTACTRQIRGVGVQHSKAGAGIGDDARQRLADLMRGRRS